METWKMMLALTGVLVVYAIFLRVTNVSLASPAGGGLFVGAIIGALIVFYLSRFGYRLGKKLGEDMQDDEEG